MIQIYELQDEEDETRFCQIGVGFDRTPAEEVPASELLRSGHALFVSILTAFILRDGLIHIFTGRAYGRLHAWPRTIESQTQLVSVVNELIVAPDEGSPYPLVFWFEQRQLTGGVSITLDELADANGDLDVLDEMLDIGLFRLFLVEEWGDFLAPPAHGRWVRQWLTSSSEGHEVAVNLR